MPEIPEIRAHAERLDSAVGGLTLNEFKVHKFPTLKTYSPTPDELVGSTCKAVASRGKLLVFDFDKAHLVIHLMQGGRLKIVESDKAKKSRPVLAHFKFGDQEDPGLLFTEAGSERKAGIWLTSEPVEELAPLVKLGPDADTVDLETFSSILAEQKGRIHGVLRTQQAITGLGRMLTNEILHRAGLSPFANVKKLSSKQVSSLYKAMQETVAQATEHERTLDEIGSAKDRPSKVHNRIGETCASCDSDEVRSVEYNAYTVAYCASCQTDGKVLADNTTSKFLK